jgi:hypothetical protein
MALKGKPSTAHEYSKTGECIHCGLYKKIVDELSHVCTKERELATDGFWCGVKSSNYRETK